MIISIIGGYGFLGYKLANIARDLGNTIILGDITRHAENDGFEFQEIDITNIKTVEVFFSNYKMDFAILTAAQTNVDFCEQNEKKAFSINAEGAINVAKICKKYRIKLVYLSTDFVFDGTRGNYSERDMPNPINVYGRSKLAGETWISTHLPKALICRTSVLYGIQEPFQHDNFAQWVINQLLKKSTLSITCDQYNSPTLIDDLANIILKLIEAEKHGIWHTAGSQCVNRYEFAIKIANTFGFDESLINPVDQFEQIAQRPKNACLSVSKLKKEMNIVPLGVDEGINQMALLMKK